MANFIKSLIKKYIRRVGFDLRRYSVASSPDAQLKTILAKHDINLVFDVGANSGQYSKALRELGYCGRIVSFEPLSDARKLLLANSKDDPLWDVAPKAALGSQEIEIEIHVAGNSISSSILNMLDTHIEAAPRSRYVGSEQVSLRRLDSLGLEYLKGDSRPFLKIDTQGYEDQVIQGAMGIFDRIIGLQLELSIIPLYEDQQLYEVFFQQLKSQGFDLWALTPGFTDSQTGRLLQFDAIFFRNR